jgi:uncharacterized protein YqjF (DUF2071 family)
MVSRSEAVDAAAGDGEGALDRLTPARRDACPRRPSGHQTWKDLLFLHWEVSPAALSKLVPAGLSIDTFEGRAYVGLVPFTMADVRFGPIKVADFRETNLRTYVHAGGVPGVWFFSLDADSALAVWGARALFRLPYFRARFDVPPSVNGDRSVAYRLTRTAATQASLDVQWTPQGTTSHHAHAGTLEHFLTERYALYGPTRNGRAYRVRVNHPPWPLQPARVDRLTTSLLATAGIHAGPPIDLMLASPKGVTVQTFARERIG